MQVQAPAAAYIPALGRSVEAGEWFEIDPAEGASLVDQGWKSMRQAAAKKAAAKKSADEKDND